jgi:hypothetical protein
MIPPRHWDCTSKTRKVQVQVKTGAGQATATQTADISSNFGQLPAIHLPGLKDTTIISVSQLLNKHLLDGQVVLKKSTGAVYDSEGQLMANLYVKNGVYEILTTEIKNSNESQGYAIDHVRFGHVPIEVLKRITHKSYKRENTYCRACAEGKMKVRNFNRKNSELGFRRRPARVMTTDTHGPFPLSIDNKKYWTSLSCKWRLFRIKA